MMNATPIRSEEGELESVVVTLQDMTALEELDRLRAEFLGMVSHELRVPLAAIKGSAATLIGSGASLDPAEMDLFFRIIEQQADQMSSLITDLLDMARIDAGELPVTPAPSDPVFLVDQAKNTFLSGGSGNNIHIDLEPDLPLVMADRRRIVQVLGNLLSNAARHSPESSAIRLSVVRDRTHAAFSVADDGAGFSAEFLPQLFRKFSRLGGANRDDGLAGSGLGLAICRGIVEAHGGRIWAESDGPGQGASFTFTLPAVDGGEHAGPSVLPDAGALPRPAGRNRPRVLAVDDDPQTLRYLRNALSDAGFAPTVTGDPRQLGRLLDDTRPHLVLLDLVLPGADGIELLESVPGLAGVPVIFLSAYGRDQTIARALEAGAVDYIVKPFSPTELAARIRTALRRREAPEPAEPSGPYRCGGTDHRLRRANRISGGPSGPTDQYGVPAALRAFGQRGPGAGPMSTCSSGSGARDTPATRGRCAQRSRTSRLAEQAIDTSWAMTPTVPADRLYLDYVHLQPAPGRLLDAGAQWSGRSSIMSIRAVDEWLSLFDDPILGNGALDRLANASYQIVIEGTSYRERLSPHCALLAAKGVIDLPTTT